MIVSYSSFLALSYFFKWSRTNWTKSQQASEHCCQLAAFARLDQRFLHWSLAPSPCDTLPYLPFPAARPPWVALEPPLPPRPPSSHPTNVSNSSTTPHRPLKQLVRHHHLQIITTPSLVGRGYPQLGIGTRITWHRSHCESLRKLFTETNTNKQIHFPPLWDTQ